MRRIKVFMLLLVISAPAVTAFAQENFLKKPVHLNLRETTVEDALLAISEKGGFNFSYNANLIDSDSLISLSLRGETVEEALNDLFRHQAEYHVAGSHLVIQIRKQYAPSVQKREYTITGYVYNHLTGEKIPYVSVYDVNSLTSAITNYDGYFNLTVSSERNYLGLAVAREDFRDTVLIIEPADKSLSIYMKPQIETAYEPIRAGIRTDPPPRIEELKIVQRLVNEDRRREASNVSLFKTTPVQVSLIPGVSFNSMSGSLENHFSLNVFGGYSKGLKGVEIGGFFNILRNDMNGFEMAGLANFVGGKVKGVQIGGIYNHAMDTASGLQVAGIVNINYETLAGVQVAGIYNHVTKDVEGWQIAGIGNNSWSSVDGLQVGGLFNFAKEEVNLFQIGGALNSTNEVGGFQIAGLVNQARTVDGFQFGGLSNVARDRVGGFQIGGISNYARNIGGYQLAGIINLANKAPKGQFSGLVNVAAHEVNGVQIAGLLNLARQVNGSQLGLINLSDTISGTPVGLLSFSRKGYYDLELSVDEMLSTQFTFRTGVPGFYNIFTGGGQLHDFQSFKTAGYGLGKKFNPSGKTAYSLEAIHRVVFEKQDNNNGISQLAQAAFRIHFFNVKKISLTAGPTANLLFSRWTDSEGKFLSQAAPYSFFSQTRGNSMVKGWVGFNLGLRY